jgi:mRNA-degrading endonuclease RelE of RelBE toxin-antitoxin system
MAQYPEAGDPIRQTGGLRKLRWAAKGRGRRGGSRVIYYFHNLDVPIFLMAIYAKGAQTDLSPTEQKALAGQLRGLKADWKRRSKK